MYVRIMKAPRSQDGKVVLGLNNVDPEQYEKTGVLVNAPPFQDGVYSKSNTELISI